MAIVSGRNITADLLTNLSGLLVDSSWRHLLTTYSTSGIFMPGPARLLTCRAERSRARCRGSAERHEADLVDEVAVKQLM